MVATIAENLVERGFRIDTKMVETVLAIMEEVERYLEHLPPVGKQR